MQTPMDDAETTPSIVERLRAAGCVFADDEAAMLVGAATSCEQLQQMVERRATGEPIEQVVGWAAFCGLRIAVDSAVFVPRRRTEFLVEQAISLLASRDVVVDLCCGTGAIGVALHAAVPHLDLYVADVDVAAAACARRNLPVERVFVGDLYEALPVKVRGHVDLIAANVPYVPTKEIGLLPTEARDHEPTIALDGGDDGLGVLRRVAAGAASWLRPGGHLLVETAQRQVMQAAAIFEASGLLVTLACDDDLDAFVLVGRSHI